MSGLLLRGAEVEGRAGVDVRVADGRVTKVGTGLPRRAEEEVVDADGGALLPGLWDAHLHLLAIAAAERSIRCGPPEVGDATALAEALAAAPADPSGWVRGIGYSESVAGPLDAAMLDRLHATRPVRLQHRSGALWVVNTAGARRLGLAGGAHPGIERTAGGTPTGRLWRADTWLRSRLPDAGPPDLAGVGARLAAFGITAVTDATPDLDDTALGALAAATRCGALPQRLELLGAPLGTRRLSSGMRVGPYKIVLADSGLPGLEALAERIATAHADRRAVAVHCVTREALLLLLAALETAGVRPGDRVEHASVVPAEVLPTLAVARLRVVTQPGFLADRGDDYLADVPAPDLPDLYRCRSLLDAGVPVGLSSDAPHGPLDPWAVIAAAADRRTPSGAVVGRDERLLPQRALDSYLATPGDPGGRPRRITAGTAADLTLLARPIADQLAAPDAGAVRLTLTGGQVSYAW